MAYEHLLSPIKIGSLTLRNRVVMGAMGNSVANEDQTIGEGARAYYAERAKGGVGLIVNEATRVTLEPHGCMQDRQTSVASDRLIPSLTKLAEAVHFYGGRIFIQLHHPGRQGHCPSEQSFTPSGIPCYLGRNPAPCHVMTKEEIKKLVGQFVDGAERCYKAGIDGVELHGAHGYLMNQFFSPFTNRRTDEYGGSTENRARFVKEIIEGIRERVGRDFPIMLRISADEFLDRTMLPMPVKVDDYLKVDEAVRICKYLIPFGLDAINVSAGVYESMNEAWEPISYPEGWKLYLAEEIKKNVDVPVFGVGVIRNPDFAEKVIREGRVDGVTIARGLLADPEWVKKTQEGRVEDIRRCISCLNCMTTMGSNGAKGRGFSCSVNARAAMEWFYNDMSIDGNGRHVVVIGAGPAGLEASRVLAIRGFKVTLLEKDSVIGGQLNLATKAPRKEKMNWLIDYYSVQMKKLGVKVVLNADTPVDTVKALNPYVVFVATGSSPIVPKSIAGVEKANVYTPDRVLNREVTFKSKHVVICGSGMTGLETAELLVEDGNRVSIVEMAERVAPGGGMQSVVDIRKHIDPHGTAYYLGHKLVEITDDGVVLEKSDGERVTLKADAVVLSLGVRSDADTIRKYKDAFEKVVCVGDAYRTGKIQTAIESGYSEAYRLR